MGTRKTDVRKRRLQFLLSRRMQVHFSGIVLVVYGYYLLFGSSLIYGAAPAKSEPAKKQASRRTDLKWLAEVFAGIPSIQGKACVAVSTGPANHSTEMWGWLMDDGPKEITLLDNYGKLHRLSRPTSDEKRITLKKRYGKYHDDL